MKSMFGVYTGDKSCHFDGLTRAFSNAHKYSVC
jgi:hypothetical protein